MTFGTARCGPGEQGSRDVFNAYVDAGSNFIDTADVYSSGRSEEMLGRFIVERGLCAQIVPATEADFAAGRTPMSGGNGASISVHPWERPYVDCRRITLICSGSMSGIR